MPMELKVISQFGFILFFRSFIPIMLTWQIVQQVFTMLSMHPNDEVHFLIMDVLKYLQDEMTFKGAG